MVQTMNSMIICVCLYISHHVTGIQISWIQSINSMNVCVCLYASHSMTGIQIGQLLYIFQIYLLYDSIDEFND